jgi:hypothetical protein
MRSVFGYFSRLCASVERFWRAASAANYLAAQGVARTRLRSTGRGESEPVASNDTEADRQKNRRVEVAIYANEAFKAEAAKNQ